MKKIVSALMMILMLFLFLAACSGTKEAQSIVIDETTLSEVYFQSSNIKFSDIKFNVTYSDGTVETVSVKAEMLTGLDISVKGTQNVTLNYKGASATFQMVIVPSELTVNYAAGEHGTISGTSEQTVNYGEDAESVKAVPDTGYKFTEWSDGVKSERRTDTNITEDISVTANFTVITYKIRFYTRNGDLITTSYVLPGETVEAPSEGLQEEGFVFIGWTKLSDNSAADLSNITSDLDLIATYTVSDVLASFYESDGTLIESYTVSYGGSVNPPSPSNIYGYEFTNWVVKGTDTVAEFTDLRQNSEFEPNYSPIEFTVTFDSNGGNALNTLNVTYLSSPNDLPVPQLAGMIFLGWYTALEGGEVFNTESIIVGDITVFARWEIKHCNVFFNTTGGSQIPSQYIVYGGKATPPSPPTRTGYTFSGWFVAETGTTTYNFNNPVIYDIVIYARWTPINYTVQFNTYGGTAVQSLTVPYGSLIDAPLSIKTGYNLLGWTTNVTTKILYDFNTPITGYTILNAVWEEQQVTVNASCNEGGSLSPSGEITIGYDQRVTVYITPYEGYKISKMTVNGMAVAITSSYTLSRTVNNLYVEFEILTYDITSYLKSAGGTITPLGKTVVNYGGSQSYTITPNSAAGYKISLVRVDGVNITGSPTTYVFSDVKANHIIEAYFTLNTYTINATSSSGGTINPKGTFTATYGSTKSFTVTPYENYHIESVLVNGVAKQIDNPKLPLAFDVINITSNVSVQAYFEGDTYTVTASAGANGTVSYSSSSSSGIIPPTATINAAFGTSVNFTINPDYGYTVSDVIVNGVSIGERDQYTFSTDVLSSDNTFEVIFEPASYNVNKTIIGSGNIVTEGVVPIIHGESRVFTLTPDLHYHLVSLNMKMGDTVYNPVIGDDNEVFSFIEEGGGFTLTIKEVTGDLTLNATYNIDVFNVALHPGNNGKIIINGESEINSDTIINIAYGGNIMITVMPLAGYHISEISLNGTPLLGYNINTYSFSINNISSNQSVVSEFSINSYNVSIISNGNGSVLYGGNPVTSFITDYGTMPSVIISPNLGYHVDMIKVNSYVTAIPENFILTLSPVTNDVTIEVIFSIDLFSIISSSPTGGTITWEEGYESVVYGDDNYLRVPYGDSVVYTFTADENYHIDSISVRISGENYILMTDGYDDGYYHYTVSGGVGQLTFKNVIENREIEATFAINTYTITSSVIGGGTINMLGDKVVSYGGNAPYAYSPNEGYQIDKVLIDGIEVSLDLYETSYTFINISANHTIEVFFIPI